MDASDAELLKRWREGDRGAGAVLFERYYDAIERFFVNKVRVGIADLVQETFMACLEARDRVVESDKFRSYLFSIAHNKLRGHLRKKYRGNDEVSLDGISVQNIDPGPRSILVKRAEQRILLEALRRIKLDLQIVLELHYWENMKVSEIAEVLQKAEGTVKTRLMRARKSLEATIKDIAESPELLRSTLSDLDVWAAQCRQEMGRGSSEGPGG